MRNQAARILGSLILLVQGECKSVQPCDPDQGRILVYILEFQASLRHFECAKRLNAAHLESYGEALEELGRFQEASDTYALLLASYPYAAQSPSIHVKRARSLANAGHVIAAGESIQKAGQLGFSDWGLLRADGRFDVLRDDPDVWKAIARHFPPEKPLTEIEVSRLNFSTLDFHAEPQYLLCPNHTLLYFFPQTTPQACRGKWKLQAVDVILEFPESSKACSRRSFKRLPASWLRQTLVTTEPEILPHGLWTNPNAPGRTFRAQTLPKSCDLTYKPEVNDPF